MTHHARKARKRRSLSSKERSAIADGLRDLAKNGGAWLTRDVLFALAEEILSAHVIIEVPECATRALRGSDSKSDPRD